MTTVLAMFAKFWQPGAVKTRLAASLGPVRAAAIHRLFVETLMRRFDAVAGERAIVFAPPDAEAALQEVAGDRWRLLPQAAGDLGQRMKVFFAESLARFDRIVLIGSDSPDLPIEYVSQAFEALGTHDVVLGPAQDGGYYLVGAARQVPRIFDGIDWGTARVWEQTLANLRSAARHWHELPSWYDIDDDGSLRALLLNLNREGLVDPHLCSLESQLLPLLK
jgi:rSAM/selenodomain-associated transferase 1